MSKESPEEPPVPKAIAREPQPPSHAVRSRAWEVEEIDPPEGEGRGAGVMKGVTRVKASRL